MRRKYFMGKILAFVLVLSLFVFSRCNQNLGKVIVKYQALNYMEKKYNEKFEIQKMKDGSDRIWKKS